MKREREAWNIEYLTVNGESLAIILEAPEMQNTLITLLAFTQTAIFVRMSPSQKVVVVELAKRYLHMKVLAIGDGYNDT